MGHKGKTRAQGKNQRFMFLHNGLPLPQRESYPGTYVSQQGIFYDTVTRANTWQSFHSVGQGEVRKAEGSL